MYRVYELTEKEMGKITQLHWDGDTNYYDVFDTQEEYDEEQVRLARIEAECRQMHEDYLEDLEGGY